MPTLNRIPSPWMACLAAGNGCCPKVKKVNCLQKAMNGFSVGIHKLFSFGKPGCDDMLCDDACDAAMIEELMLPPSSATHHHDHGAHDHSHGDHSHEHGDHVHPHATGDHDAVPNPESVEKMPPPIRLQEPPSNPDRGSLFDTETDPFSDDDARVRTYRPIRPSAYEKVELRPIHPQQTSSRQSNRRVRRRRRSSL